MYLVFTNLTGSNYKINNISNLKYLYYGFKVISDHGLNKTKVMKKYNKIINIHKLILPCFFIL